MTKPARVIFVMAILAIFTVSVIPALANPAPSPPATATPTTRVVQGELLKMDGEFYIVKNKNGEEVRLRVDKETLLDIRMKIRMKIGDKLDATVMADGRTASIIIVQ